MTLIPLVDRRQVIGALALAAPSAHAAGQLSFERVDAVVGSPTTAIQARDLKGDGWLDLVVSGGQSVFVLTGRGDGRFDVTWSGAAGESPVDLAIADLDEEGLADLAVANHETDHVTLLFGIARGAIERRDHSRCRVDISPHPHAVRLHDIDSDGHGPSGRRPVARVHPAVPGSRGRHFLGGDIDRCRR